jgi:glycosyltransferase involved in cell wall biosynthesis
MGHHVDIVAHPEIRRLVAGEVRLSTLLLHLPRLATLIERYDVINLHGIAPTFSDIFLLFAYLRRRRRPPLVYTHHCDIAVGPLAALDDLYNTAHRWLAATADEVVTTSSAYAAALDGVAQPSIIPLGVDLARFTGGRGKDPRFTVLFVGQFRPCKGVPVLLQAAGRLRLTAAAVPAAVGCEVVALVWLSRPNRPGAPRVPRMCAARPRPRAQQHHRAP